MQKIDRLIPSLRLVVLSFGVIAFSAQAQVAPVAPPASPSAPVLSSGVQSSIETVDELIKAENAEVLGKTRSSGPAASGPPLGFPFGPGGPNVTMAPVAPSIVVGSIYGAGGRMSTDLIVNGQKQDGLRVGSKVGSCVVREIVNKCVALAPASRATSRRLCPTSCWTGDTPAPVDMSSAMAPGAEMVARPMPMPLPAGSQVAVPPMPMRQASPVR